jgi:hypothetical protein
LTSNASFSAIASGKSSSSYNNNFIFQILLIHENHSKNVSRNYILRSYSIFIKQIHVVTSKHWRWWWYGEAGSLGIKWEISNITRHWCNFTFQCAVTCIDKTLWLYSPPLALACPPWTTFEVWCYVSWMDHQFSCPCLLSPPPENIKHK